jgi:hypothetical protein
VAILRPTIRPKGGFRLVRFVAFFKERARPCELRDERHASPVQPVLRTGFELSSSPGKHSKCADPAAIDQSQPGAMHIADGTASLSGVTHQRMKRVFEASLSVEIR